MAHGHRIKITNPYVTTVNSFVGAVPSLCATILSPSDKRLLPPLPYRLSYAACDVARLPLARGCFVGTGNGFAMPRSPILLTSTRA